MKELEKIAYVIAERNWQVEGEMASACGSSPDDKIEDYLPEARQQVYDILAAAEFDGVQSNALHAAGWGKNKIEQFTDLFVKHGGTAEDLVIIDTISYGRDEFEMALNFMHQIEYSSHNPSSARMQFVFPVLEGKQTSHEAIALLQKYDDQVYWDNRPIFKIATVKKFVRDYKSGKILYGTKPDPRMGRAFCRRSLYNYNNMKLWRETDNTKAEEYILKNYTK